MTTRTYVVSGKTIKVNIGLKDIPYYVWRDTVRFAASSIDTQANITFYFPNMEHLNQAKKVLEGALFVPSDNG
jgi:hypothetical protein